MSETHIPKSVVAGDKQEVFDKIVAHLRQQNAKAIDRNDICSYRSRDGSMSCAAGCLIPDEHYNESMEMRSVRNIFRYWPVRILDLLGSMQAVHDQHPPDRWEDRFAKTAKYYDLKYTPLPKGKS